MVVVAEKVEESLVVKVDKVAAEGTAGPPVGTVAVAEAVAADTAVAVAEAVAVTTPKLLLEQAVMVDRYSSKHTFCLTQILLL